MPRTPLLTSGRLLLQYMARRHSLLQHTVNYYSYWCICFTSRLCVHLVPVRLSLGNSPGALLATCRPGHAYLQTRKPLNTKNIRTLPRCTIIEHALYSFAVYELRCCTGTGAVQGSFLVLSEGCCGQCSGLISREILTAHNFRPSES